MKIATISPVLFSRLSRIPQRLYADFCLITLLNNWQEAIEAKLTGKSLQTLSFRNGIVLNGPTTISLAFLLQEIWIDKIYKYPGYHIKAGDVIIDIGANIGAFSTYAATQSSDVKVYAYEPFPQNVDWLRFNLKNSDLNNVAVFQQAVARSPGMRSLQVNRFSWICHSLIATEKLQEEDLKVQCITLDEIITENKIEKCDLLKLDCEGSEYEILEGSSLETLSKIKKIVCEYHTLNSQQKTGKYLVNFLQSRFFEVDKFYSFDDNSGIICAKNTKA